MNFSLLIKKTKQCKRMSMKIYNHINKMGIFNNVDRYTNVDISQYIRNISQIIQASRGMK